MPFIVTVPVRIAALGRKTIVVTQNNFQRPQNTNRRQANISPANDTRDVIVESNVRRLSRKKHLKFLSQKIKLEFDGKSKVLKSMLHKATQTRVDLRAELMAYASSQVCRRVESDFELFELLSLSRTILLLLKEEDK